MRRALGAPFARVDHGRRGEPEPGGPRRSTEYYLSSRRQPPPSKAVIASEQAANRCRHFAILEPAFQRPTIRSSTCSGDSVRDFPTFTSDIAENHVGRRGMEATSRKSHSGLVRHTDRRRR